MLKNWRLYLIFCFFTISFLAHADDVIQIKGDKALASISNVIYREGEIVEIRNLNGDYSGRAKVLQVSQKKSKMKIQLIEGNWEVGNSLNKLKSIENFKKTTEDKWNITFWPLNILAFWQYVTLERVITEKMTLGLIYESISPPSLLGVTIKYNAYGAHLKYYLAPEGVFGTGWVGGVTLGTVSANSSFSLLGTNASASAQGSYFGVTYGYHWFWDSFNLFLGGNTRKSNLTSETNSSTGVNSNFTYFTGTSTVLDFSIGWKF